jgi:hypothetical protein
VESPHTRFDRGIRIAIVALLLLLVILCGLLSWQVWLVSRSMPHGHSHFSQLHGTAPATDPSVIQSWMTFDYVGHIFRLQPDYLKTAVDITDARYPRLTIIEAAEASHQSVDTYLALVRDAVQRQLQNPGT